ncbi:hypothetical protein BO71DRAFT_369521 [Aspergillus ellipticus CBS 707.79]|uniref:Prolyl 4-hydroxylase alpha subunit domain-containing protein n=1 Tax=Aspergillus ellipticus CBS 707.79 TaxID=1448320 RepID=A0A319E6H1_9EURO|nr:hypothetical protein BO71DRAFT_369521 [Aspergillus ellipticus CBS 707.79]
MSGSNRAARGLSHIPFLLSLAAVPFFFLLYPSKVSYISVLTPVQNAPAGCSNHQYSIEIISQDPLMIYVNNFLSDKEMKWLLKKGESEYKRMLTYEGNSLSDTAVPDEGRTSYSAYLDKQDPIMERIGARALDFHGGAQRALGDYGNPQLVRYEPGQKVNLHYDWWQEPQNRAGLAGKAVARECGLLGQFTCKWHGRYAHPPCLFARGEGKESGDELLASSVLLKAVIDTVCPICKSRIAKGEPAI